MNKRVLITGANGGIGRSLVKAFAKEGYDILAHLRNENSGFVTFAEKIATDYNINISYIYFDLSDDEKIKEGIKSLASKKIHINVLVNNAGIAHGGLMQMTPMKEIKQVFNINFFAAVQLSQLVSRMMAKQGGGAIVNLASISGMELDAGNCAYGTSKAALMALTKTTAKELASQNIRVNAVAPGLTDTHMAELMESKAGESMVRKTAFERLAKPEEIADAVVYLASDRASFITGQVLRVDGGM